MGKWNKAPPQVSQEFLQNEERRKQMIIEAAKRRKQKERKLQQQAEQQKKQQQQALTRHKQQKKDAYVKYLRNNMHDKYEEMKRNQKINQPQIRSKSKWKKDTLDSQSQVKSEYNLQGLNLQVNIDKRNYHPQNNNKVSNKVGGQVVRSQSTVNKNIKLREKQQQASIWTKQQVNYANNLNKQQSQKRRMLQDQFQNMWKQEHSFQQEKQIDYELSVEETVFDEMMGSKLLDSLDLDLDTVTRGKNIDKKLKKQSQNQKNNNNKNEIDEIKNMIGYQSVLMSIDQRSEMIKKYNEFMKNQVQNVNHIKIQQQDDKNSQQKSNKNIKNARTLKPAPIQKNQKPLNQGQLFNQLKNKKQGKILNWAKDQAQQADDLFSNCSTNKKSRVRGSQLLKQINKQILQKGKKQDMKLQNVQNNGSSQQINMKKKDRALETIPQKKINSSLQKLRQRSYDKKISSGSNLPINSDKKQQPQIPKNSFSRQKNIENSTKPRPNRMNSAQYRNVQPPQPPRNISRERAHKTATNSFKQNNNILQNRNYPEQRNRTDSRRSLSKQKQGTWSSKNISNNGGNGYSRDVNKTSSQILSGRQPPVPQNIPPQAKKLPHLPQPFPKLNPNNETITLATQDQVFQVESFIKNELVALNRQQRQLQQDLRNIHLENKEKLKDVQKKYQIKTDYKHSYQLMEKQNGQIQDQCENQSLNSYQRAHKKQTEDELQDSIQRLDDMLLRKEIINKEKSSRITEQDNESESTHRSLINPMSDPISLHKQVLQLAENLSRYEGQPEDITTGYGAKLRMKKKSASKQKLAVPQIKKPNIQPRKQTDVDLSQSQDVNQSQINGTQQRSRVSKFSKVSKPPSLQYDQYNCNIPAGYGESGILDDQLEDSIEKGKIQVNERLKKMLLD